jgi:hypothetical protein
VTIDTAGGDVRASTYTQAFAASAGAPSADPAPIMVCLVDEQDEIRPLLDLADDILHAVLEHAAQHRSCNDRIHLQADHLAIAQSWRHSLLFELEAMCKPFDDRCLANARLANQHPEFDRSR